jgi:hypothetical protein
VGEKERFKRGVPVVGIIEAGHLYQVQLKTGDWLFLSEDEKRALGCLKVGESLRVSDRGRAWILWRERGRVLAYEKIQEGGSTGKGAL